MTRVERIDSVGSTTTQPALLPPRCSWGDLKCHSLCRTVLWERSICISFDVREARKTVERIAARWNGSDRLSLGELQPCDRSEEGRDSSRSKHQ